MNLTRILRPLGFSLLMLLLALALVPNIALAQAGSNEETQKLALAKKSILDLRELQTAGLISKAELEDSTQHFLTSLTFDLKRQVTLEEVMAAPNPVYNLSDEQLTWLQRAAGYVNAATVLWFIAAIIGVISFSVLFGSYVAKLIKYLKNVPMFAYQLLFFALSAGLVIGGWFTPDPIRMYMVFFGSLLVAAALAFTAQTWEFVQKPFNFSIILFVIWAATAFAYGSSVIGFMTVAALLSALGFSIMLEPLCYGIGFRDEASVGRATVAAFLILIAFVVMRLLNRALPELRIFEFGSLFLGSFVGYLGLVILSSRWFPFKRPALMNVITFIAGVLAIVIGLSTGIGVLAKIGGSFFVLWGIEKMMEIKAENKVGYAWLGMSIFGAVTAFSLLVYYNQALFSPVLFIPGT